MTAMITKDQSYWEPEQSDILQWQQLFPAVDVYQELNGMCAWLDANPSKRKTVRGMKRFVASWLTRAQDKGGSPFAEKPKPKDKTPTREMSHLDDLTHIIIGTDDERAMYLKKYGQYYENGQRFTA